jgi:hypothetical protein
MPSIGHILFGITLTIPIMLIARDRMNYKAVLIFLMNNYFGPDSFYPFIFLPINGHTLLGYVAWAAFLALLYSYISRFSISRDKWRFYIHDDGRIEVPYRQAYMLCLAGGICHFFVDMIGHHGYQFYLSQWFTLNLDQVQAWGDAYYHNIGAAAAFGYLFILLVVLLLFQVLQQDSKKQYLFILCVWGTVVLVMLIFGGITFAELEISMTFIISLYFLLPMTLLYAALAQVYEYNQKYLKNEISSPVRKVNAAQILKIVIGILLVLAIGLFIAGIVVLGLADAISERYGYDRNLFHYGAIAGMVLAGILVVVSILVALKKEIGRQIVIGICFLSYITVVTLVIAFALCEKDVKAMFK